MSSQSMSLFWLIPSRKYFAEHNLEQEHPRRQARKQQRHDDVHSEPADRRQEIRRQTTGALPDPRQDQRRCRRASQTAERMQIKIILVPTT